jgi:beta-mannanase
VVLTLLFWEGVTPDDRYSLRAIAGGELDGEIDRWAAELRSFGIPIVLRPLHDFNTSTYPWGIRVGENRPEHFAPAWRHLVRRFRRAGANNVRFELSLTRLGSNGSTVVEAVSQELPETPIFWPGDGFVDIVGFDVYNRPPDDSHRWQWFDELFSPSYEAATSWTDKPIWIQELSSTGIGGDKAAWIEDAFGALRTRYPRVTSVTWFNHSAGGIDDWEFDSTPEAREALARAVNPSVLPESRPRAPFAPGILESLVLAAIGLIVAAFIAAGALKVSRTQLPDLREPPPIEG